MTEVTSDSTLVQVGLLTQVCGRSRLWKTSIDEIEDKHTISIRGGREPHGGKCHANIKKYVGRRKNQLGRRVGYLETVSYGKAASPRLQA